MVWKDTPDSSYEKAFIRDRYCLHCKQWIIYTTSHDCPTIYTITIDGALRGIVDRLYQLGIMPNYAWFELGRIDEFSQTYCIKIFVELKQQLSCEVLGELPAGWYYGWAEETNKICMIGYWDYQCYVGAMRAKERVNEVAAKFERFLIKRDADAVKALLLLTEV